MTTEPQLINTVCAPHCGNYPCEFQAWVKDSEIVRFRPHPQMTTAPCLKGFSLPDRLMNPERVLYPLRRVGPRGGGRWERISWQEALEAVSQGLEDAKVRHGNDSVAMYHYASQHTLPGGKNGAEASIFRLLNLWGGCVPAYQRGSLCWSPFIEVSRRLFGSWQTVEPQDGDCNWIVLWGNNPFETAVRGPLQSFRKAKKAGTKFAVIDPVASETVERLSPDEHLRLTPGTDIALALSMMEVILSKGLIDMKFLARYTNAPFLVQVHNGRFLREKDLRGSGSTEPLVWEESKGDFVPFPKARNPALSGQFSPGEVSCVTALDRLTQSAMAWPPERAAEVCGVPAEQIRRLALAFGKAGSGRAKVVVRYGGYQRNVNGEDAVAALHALNILTGNFRGVLTGDTSEVENYHGEEHATELTRVTDIGIQEVAKRYATPNPVLKRFPVNHLAEAILNPNRYGTNLHALLVMWGNPVNQNGDTKKTIEALKTLDFIAVSDIFLTATVQYADVVLPASTNLERYTLTEGCEVGRTFYPALYDDEPKMQLFYGKPVIPPRGESKDDFDIVCALAKVMGYGDAFPWTSAREWIEEMIDIARRNPRLPWLKDVTMERLEREGVVDIPVPRPGLSLALSTPSGRVELYNEGAIDRELSPVPCFGVEDGIRIGAITGNSYPLHFLTPKTIFRACSTFSNEGRIRRHNQRFNRLLMHPDDAVPRDIQDGDTIEVFNERGRIEVEVHVSSRGRPGVVRLPQGGYPEDGLVNILTSDALSGLSENAAYNACGVEVSLLSKDLEQEKAGRSAAKVL